jgi:hypothetical protein
MNDLISRKALLAEYDRVHIGEPGKARKLIEDAPAVREWIPVSERLPKLYETVIVCDVREQYVGAWMYYGNGDWVYDDKMFDTEEITHWMPLPEPPKEG